MCFKYIAKKINIFNRNPEDITINDIYMTYIFIFCFTGILSIYSYRYYLKIQIDMDECEKYNSNTICARTEFDHIIVPYVGIIYGFSLTFYNIHNCIAIFLNLLCCLNICSKNKDNSHEEQV